MNYVNMLYIAFLMIVIMASAFLFSEKFRYWKNTDSYKGYLVYDEEMVGFYPCKNGEPYGVDYRGKINIRSIYQANKTKIREPVYFEIIAETTDSGDFGYGLVPEPAHGYLQITEITRVERHSEMKCGARLPYRGVEVMRRDH